MTTRVKTSVNANTSRLSSFSFTPATATSASAMSFPSAPALLQQLAEVREVEIAVVLHQDEAESLPPGEGGELDAGFRSRRYGFRAAGGRR